MSRVVVVTSPDRPVNTVSTTPGVPGIAVTTLTLLLLVPLVTTLVVIPIPVNLIAGAVLIAAAPSLGFKLERRWLRAPANHATGGVLVALGIWLVAWQWQIGDLWLNRQFVLYCGIGVTLTACTAWFRRYCESSVRLIFELKLGSVIASSLVILAAVWLLPADPGALRDFVQHPPLYGHIRHFNYDQLPAVAFAFYFASRADSRASQLAWLVVLTLMGFLMAWSGGRGVMISLCIFLVLVAVFRILPRRSIAVWSSALVLGAVIVVVTGRGDDLFLRIFFKWSGSLNDISSNRLDLWLSSLNVWREDWLSIIFGFGPDAMRTTVRAQIGFPPNVQPHNAFIQVLIEFGIVGLSLFIAVVGGILRRALAILRTSGAPAEGRIVAALLIAFGAYMLVDGIIYHAIPLIMVMLLIAYLFSFDLVDSKRAAESAPA